MPTYEFQCDECSDVQELFYRMSDRPSAVSCSCGSQAQIRISKKTMVSVFKPFKTDVFTGRNIEIRSKEDRDSLCKEHGLTMDDCRYVRPSTYKPVVDSVDYGQVKQAMQKGVSDG